MQASAALTGDRFLVQLTKLENPPSKTLSAEEIANLWANVPKEQMIQYKLKVDLSQEVMLKVNEGDPTAAGRMQEVMGTLKGGVADRMIKDDRQEEAKERFDSHKPPKINKGYMEDIKEQDSEQDSNRASMKKDSRVVPTPADGAQVQTKIKQLTEKKQKLQAQLT